MLDGMSSGKKKKHILSVFCPIVFLAAFAGSLPFVCPSVYWLDSGELQTAIPTLGIPHSPSFPLYVLSARPFMHLPFGDLAFRANLATAFAGSVMAVLVYLVCTCLFRPHSMRSHLAAVVTAWMAVMNPMVWFQNLKAEIYSLNMVILLGIILSGIRILDTWEYPRQSARWAAVMAVMIGLGLSNHSLLTAHVLPAAGVLLLCRLPRLKPRELMLMVLLFILTTSLYLYLPVRSSVGPLLDTGNPENRMNFVNAVTRRGTYNRFFGNLLDDYLANWGVYFSTIRAAVSWPFLAAAICGLILLLKKRFRLAIMLVAMLAVNLGVTLLNKNFNANPDTGPAYLMLSTTVWIIGFGYLLFLAVEKLHTMNLGKRLIPAIFVVPLGFIFVWFLRDVTESNLAGDESAGIVGRSILEICNPDAAVFYGMYHNLPFVVNYLQYVEYYRVDVKPVSRGELVYWPGGLENLTIRYPELTDPVMNGPYGSSLRYLAPRSSRHSEAIPYQQARDLLFNASAWMAQNYASRGSVYWFSSEDDHLLRTDLYRWGPMFRLGPQDSMEAPAISGDRSRAMDRLILRRARVANNRGFQQTRGARVLSTFYDLQCITLSNRLQQNEAINTFKLSEQIDPTLGRNCEPRL